MACAIDSIITLDCNDGVAGIEWIAVAETANIDTFTADSSGNVSVLTMDAGKYFYLINLSKETATFTETQTDPTETQSASWSQAVTFTTRKLTANNRRFLQLLAYNRLTVIIKTRNGEYLLMGKTGAYQTASEATTGKNFGEFNGHTVTITSREPLPFYVVASNQISASLIQGL